MVGFDDFGRNLLFVISSIVFAVGSVAFGLGIWALVDKNKINFLTKDGAASSNFSINGLLESAAIVLLVGGVCVMVLGFIGCFGAIMQNKCVLVCMCSYAIFMLLIVILEIAAISIAASFRGKITTEMKSFLIQRINSKYQGRVDTNEPFSLGLDFAQVYFQCCGIDSYADFNRSSEWNRTGEQGIMKIPPACCKLKDKDAFLKHQKYEPINWNCPYNPTAINSNMSKYAIFMLLIVILEIAAISIAASFRGKITTEMKSFLIQRINSKYQGRVDTNEPFSLGLDFAQVYFQCCGIDSYADFNRSSEWNRTGEQGIMKIPPACCKLKDKDAFLKHQKYEPINWNCPYNPTAINSNMSKPCWKSIEDHLKSRIGVIIGIAAFILVSELLCVVVAGCIIRSMPKYFG